MNAGDTWTIASMSGEQRAARCSVEFRGEGGKLGKRVDPHARNTVGARMVLLNESPWPSPDECGTEPQRGARTDVVVEPITDVENLRCLARCGLGEAAE